MYFDLFVGSKARKWDRLWNPCPAQPGSCHDGMANALKFGELADYVLYRARM